MAVHGSKTGKGGFRCGSAAVEITPPAGTHLAGSGHGNHRPARTLLDPLFARALVFESGGKRICLVALDVTVVAEEYTDQIRKACKEWGMAPEAVMVHGTQTHSAPALGNFMLDKDFPMKVSPNRAYLFGGEKAFSEMATARAIEAVGEAVKGLKPASVGVGRAVAHGWAFNRRAITRQGTLKMPPSSHTPTPPLGPTDILYIEGPDDPELAVLCVRDEDLRVPAFMANFTCHPVWAFSRPQTKCAVTSDWPGVLTATLEKGLGDGCTGMVINGCCGNINPRPPFDSGSQKSYREMGETLAARARQVIDTLQDFDENPAVDFRTETVELDYRDIPAERAEEVERILSENPEPLWEESGEVDRKWFRAATTRSVELCRKRLPKFPYEIQVFRVGDAAIVGLPGEPFVEGQLAVKMSSPAGLPMVAHMISHYAGYLPTRAAYANSGHEANIDVTYWAKFAAGSLESVVERARAMIEDLFQD
jgi:hypothetical protein